jgi:hypothetical protein
MAFVAAVNNTNARRQANECTADFSIAVEIEITGMNAV